MKTPLLLLMVLISFKKAETSSIITNFGSPRGERDSDSDDLLIFSDRSVVKGDTVSVIEGEDLELSCKYKGNVRENTVWEISNIGMKNNPYTVSKVERSYGGIHYCTLDRSGTILLTRKVIVKVLYPPSKVAIVPSSSIEDDTSLNLTCYSDSNPPATLTWRYGSSYYAPVISEGPVLTINQLSEQKIVYCTASNIMIPTNGLPVEKVATAEFRITDDDKTGHTEQRAAGVGGFTNNENDSLGLVAATVLGWVFAAVAAVVAIFLYRHIRVISKRENETMETRSPLFRSAPASNTPRVFASNSQNKCTSERMKMSRSKSSIDCSNEERPKVPHRPPQTLPLDKAPLHSYIEIQSPDDSALHIGARPDSEEIYEHIEDGMPDSRKRYEDLNHSDMNVKVEENTLSFLGTELTEISGKLSRESTVI